ncbi:MAG: bifunctional 4-hydroxy-2-oxoglutarate aldolase/2-dehydro-3-deoxy-phosphogluconate aldolase [Casimicrobium sp.]
MSNASLTQTLRTLRYVPVIELDDANNAVPLAEALVAGGIGAIEVTLRTKAGLEGIARIATANVPILCGAGTVINANQAQEVFSAGAKFAVSPGYTPALGEKCRAIGLPLIPGAVTPSEIITLLDAGYEAMKFFPASTYGGVGWLKAIRGPLPQAQFMATGGIKDDDMPSYWEQPNLLAVGSSSVASAELIRARAWDEIAARARTVMARAAGVGR